MGFVLSKQPPPESPNAAFQSAIAISELFEPILEHLPPPNILVLRRVCRHFQTFIDTSATLQRKTWMRAPSGESVDWALQRVGGKGMQRFVPASHGPSDKGLPLFTVARPSPFLLERHPNQRCDITHMGALRYNHGDEFGLGDGTIALIAAYLNGDNDSSWSRMLLCSPPAKSVKLELYLSFESVYEEPTPFWLVDHVAEGADCATFAALMDNLLQDHGSGRLADRECGYLSAGPKEYWMIKEAMSPEDVVSVLRNKYDVQVKVEEGTRIRFIGAVFATQAEREEVAKLA